MHTIHIGTGAINTTPKDWEGNIAKILAVIAEAKSRHVRLLCLPELCVSGYNCEDEFHSPYVHELAQQLLLTRIVPETAGIAVTVGLPLYFRGAVYNVIAFIADGCLRGFVPKQNLAGDGIHYEPRYFKPWPPKTASTHGYTLGGKTREVPIGDLVFNCNGIRIGFEICEDAWISNRPGNALSLRGVDIILNPSASHFSFLKTEIRERFVLEGSRAFNCAYAYANLIGNEAGRTIYDGECLIASGGQMLSRGPRLNYRDWVLNTAIVNTRKNRVQRSRVASFRPSMEEDAGAVSVDLELQHSFLGEEPCVLSHPAAEFESSPELKCEEFERAVALGLWDYMRKSRSRGFVVSLSGGADSAACAVLVHLMVKYANEDNPAQFREATGLDPDAPATELTGKMLTCVYQATKNSGDVTRNAAKSVAEGIGARYLVFDVQPIVEEYERLMREYLGRDLDWERDDIALQNIQARGRAPSIWSIANLENFLLLATSNRSEAAVGYCTMDGDTAGSLSPLNGIDKDFLIRWLAFACKRHVPELREVLNQKPTAELRPQSSRQTDEADLMPYDLLNFIQKQAVVYKRGPLEVYHDIRRAGEQFGRPDDEQIYQCVSRYFQLWSRNQWKRERYAPSFHLDDENLDPRSWCRFPILSGGYDYELRELAKYLGLDS